MTFSYTFTTYSLTASGGSLSLVETYSIRVTVIGTQILSLAGLSDGATNNGSK